MYTVVAAETAVNDEREPVKFVERIGSTDYVVSIRFNERSNETLEDRILRMIESEVLRSA